jgi:hypothetical protein
MDTDNTNKDFIKDIEEYENNYKKELESTIKDLPNFSLRLNDIYDLLSDKILSGCKKEIEELNKNLKSDFLATNEFVPLPGKEKEVQIAYEDYYFCSFYPSSIINTYHNIEDALLELNGRQMKHCKDDCIKKNNLEISNTKNCLKNCIDYAFNYSRKATYEMIESALDFTEKDIKKIGYENMKI